MTDDLRILAEEQAALRRVATLVARGATPEEVFAAVTQEIGRLLPVDSAGMGRYDPDRTLTFVASWGALVDYFPVGTRLSLEGQNVGTVVFETGRPARIESYSDSPGGLSAFARERGVRSSIGAPIIVQGRLWGVVGAGSSAEQPLPAETEARLASFTELLATAIANAESRAGLARLAEEQAALRRVATLVARGATPDEVFAAVTDEVGQLLDVDFAYLARYEPAGTVLSLAAWGRAGPVFPAGGRLVLGGKNVTTLVFETGRPARIDSYGEASGAVGLTARQSGFRSSVGSPIVVEGHLWGVVIAGSTVDQALPGETEARLASFTELVATAIANAESRADLAASRARIVAAADETRRRIERDLHDGAQQRLVSLLLELRTAQPREPSDVGELNTQLARTERAVADVVDELRELSRGIHPPVLSEGGLCPALRTLARRSSVPVELDLQRVPELPRQVEVAAYYVVSEALTNAVKHAQASVVRVDLEAHEANVRLAIRDDGIGGADRGQGSGLVGLSDRIAALGGTLEITSPSGSGTTLLVTIPLQRADHTAPTEP